MKTMYMIFAGCVFLLFASLQLKGVALDANETAPKPNIYTSRGGGGGGSSFSSFGYFSSK